MGRFSGILVCLLSASNVLASPAPVIARSNYAVKDTHPVPRGWARVAPAPGEHTINLNIALKQSQFLELERHLYEVSDPAHERYGQHLTSDEVNELVKPSDDALSSVQDWLEEHGIASSRLQYSPAKDWISVVLPVKAIERLLNTKYSIFEHEDGSRVIRAPQWSLPVNLHKHIQTIQPTNSFFRPKSRKSTLKIAELDAPVVFEDFHDYPADLSVSAVCNSTGVTPLCLRTLYGTVDYVPIAAGKNKVALNNFLGETNNRSDVHIFLSQYRPDAAPAAYEFDIQIIAGGENPQGPLNATDLADGLELEGNLDAETILGITYPTPLTAYNTGGSPPFVPDDNTPTDTNEPYLVWLQYILAQQDLPQVISASYGDDEQTVPYSYAVAVCNSYAQLGARGVTALFASGDDGVGSNGTCYTNDGTNTTTFLPSFPDGCPYVTSVGATKNTNPEVVAYDAANGFASGGGFSNYFARPSYQDGVVPQYIASLGGEYAGLYNASGRGYPDISAQGQRFITIWNGSVAILDGTSASTPTASSVISLVNDGLLALGRPPLGFLNPWLYSKGFPAFTDITSGSSIGCDTAGFPAKEGWDAVSGFGTPYFPKILPLALLTGE